MKRKGKFYLIYLTTPSKKEVEKIAKKLLKEKLVACANIFKIDSFFFWEGKMQKQEEFGVFLKTKEKLTKEIIKKIKKIHSYKVPCIISFEIKEGDKEFLNWIEKSTL